MAEHVNSPFEQWWKRQCEVNAPGLLRMTAKQIAQNAFEHGVSIGGNYTTDTDTFPMRVFFENGRIITLVESAEGENNGEPYLTICWKLPRYEEG